MQYTILIYETKAGFEARTDEKQKQAYWQGTMAYVTAIRESGIFVAGAGLETPDKASSLFYKDGKPVIQDGPAIEVKEQLGGLFIVNCQTQEEAMSWAARFPQRAGVRVEVRPNLPRE